MININVRLCRLQEVLCEPNNKTNKWITKGGNGKINKSMGWTPTTLTNDLPVKLYLCLK